MNGLGFLAFYFTLAKAFRLYNQRFSAASAVFSNRRAFALVKIRVLDFDNSKTLHFAFENQRFSAASAVFSNRRLHCTKRFPTALLQLKIPPVQSEIATAAIDSYST